MSQSIHTSDGGGNPESWITPQECSQMFMDAPVGVLKSTPEGKRKKEESMKLRSLILIINLLLIFTTGCATKKNTDSVSYNMFFKPDDHIESLIEKKRYIEASKVYNTEKEYFRKLKNTNKLLITLSENLNSLYKGKLENKTEEIKELEWPAKPKGWKPISKEISDCYELLEEYDRHEVLKTSSKYLPQAEELKKILQSKEKKMSNSAHELFSQYPLDKRPQFFKLYPVELNIDQFLREECSSIINRLKDENVKYIEQVYDIYHNNMSDKCRENLANTYYKSMLKKLSSNNKASFDEIFKSIQATQGADLPLKKIPDTKIALIDVSSKSLLKQGQIEFPVAIKEDLPIATSKSSFTDTFSKEHLKKYDIIIILNTSVSKTYHNIEKKQKIESRYQSGTQTVPNSRYNSIQNKLNITQQKLQNAKAESRSIDSQYCSGMGCAAKVASQIAIGKRISELQNELQDLMKKLNKTPMQIEKPTYSPYSFNYITMNSRKKMTVNYYIIDNITKCYVHDTFDATESKKFRLAYNIRKEDKNRKEHLQKVDSEKDVDEFDSKPIEVNLSDILKQLMYEDHKIKDIPKLAKLQKLMLKHKNIAISKYESKQYDVVKDKDDIRYDGVVLIYHPDGSIGSGFFIKEDLVLTNYHVIDESKYVEMKLYNGQETFGKVVDYDIRLDLALIKTQARGTPLEIYNSQTLPLGVTVEAIGNPENLEYTITKGVVSSLRDLKSSFDPQGKPIKFIQTDTPVNPGNSGGPLFLNNKVIGIITQKLVRRDIEGISFAIHYSEIQNFLSQIL